MTENKEKPQPFTINGVDKYRVKEIVYANGQRRYIPQLQLASHIHVNDSADEECWINIAEENFKKGYFLIIDARHIIKKRKEEHQGYKAQNTIVETNYYSEE